MPVYPVKNNLVVNGDFSDGNTGFSSDYSFVPSFFSETQYTICLASAMDTSTQYASRKFFYWLCRSTGGRQQCHVGQRSNCGQSTNMVGKRNGHATYRLRVTAYAADVNISGGSLADVQASINGISGATLQTTYDWQQASFVWNSGDNTLASISLTDLNTSGGANDFAMDKISFAELALPPVITSNSKQWQSDVNRHSRSERYHFCL